MPPHLRLATHQDLSTVEDIVHRAYSPYVLRIGGKPGPMHDDYRARIEAGQVQVAEIGGAIRAVLVLVAERDAMLLDNIAVDPSAQGQGLGRILLDHAERIATDLGYHAIRLYTNEAMTENIGLYRRVGYAEIRRAEESGFKRVYMVKPLG